MRAPDDATRKKLKRPVVSDLDGTREGGLAFCITMIGGMVLGAAFVPGALTSFWVWVGLLAMAIAVAVNLQSLVARLTGFRAQTLEDDETENT